MCCCIVLIQTLKIQALKLKLDTFPGSAWAKDVCGTDVSGRVEQFYFHTCLVISVDVVPNLKMYEDTYIHILHDAYRWLLATSWIFVFTGGVFRHEIHCQHSICKMLIQNPWSSPLPTSGVFCTSFFLHWRALTHPMWGRHDEMTNVLRILRNAMLQIRVSEFR